MRGEKTPRIRAMQRFLEKKAAGEVARKQIRNIVLPKTDWDDISASERAHACPVLMNYEVENTTFPVSVLGGDIATRSAVWHLSFHALCWLCNGWLCREPHA